MINTTEMTPQKLKDVKECAAKLNLTLEQTPWEIILWHQDSMQVFFKTHVWSEILDAIDFDYYMKRRMKKPVDKSEEIAYLTNLGYKLRPYTVWWIEGADGYRVTGLMRESADEAWSVAIDLIRSTDESPIWKIKPLKEEIARYRRMGYVMRYQEGFGWWVEGAEGFQVTKDGYETCDEAWAKASKEIQSLKDAPWRIKLRPLLDS